ncbi:MAG TPA: PilZ domain-containing protein [Terriglobales bacterium]
MPPKLLESLRLSTCSHEFSWPRRAADGRYYQVCLVCADEYQYDWDTMKRVKRVERASPADSTTQRRRSHTKKPTWVPRARRLKVQGPLRYRVKNLGQWFEGTVENLSQSGVLFYGTQHFPVNALVEMVFEMPEEISGQKNSAVLCDARIIRANVAAKDKETDEAASAAVILGYKFIHSSPAQSC